MLKLTIVILSICGTIWNFRLAPTGSRSCAPSTLQISPIDAVLDAAKMHRVAIGHSRRAAKAAFVKLPSTDTPNSGKANSLQYTARIVISSI
jgi:hypothetical protein